MNILVTGANGFIGKNLIAELRNQNYHHILEYDTNKDMVLLDQYTKECDFVFHLAGINRPQAPEEYMEGNYGFTGYLLDKLKKYNKKSPILMTSSIQAELSNPYGESKKAGEDLLFSYEKETGSKVMVYRLPNVFGKWCRPNYNSVIATFCHNIANGLQININDPDKVLELVYIDDVFEEFIRAMEGKENRQETYCFVPSIYTITLGKIADLLYSFHKNKQDLSIPNMQDEFEKKLYSTYLSYLPTNQFHYPLMMHTDNRGSFTEFLRTPDRGQISINILKPGMIKGNHWHHSKNEKFLIVSGTGVIRLRKIGSNETILLYVSGEKLEVINIVPGYIHNIENLGTSDMVTIIWANEYFNPDKRDTFIQEV